MVRYLPFLISLVLTIYALFSCIQTKDEDVPHLPKLLWVLLIVLVPFVGPITWLLMARSQARKRRSRTPSGYDAGPARRGRAPDDDPEFLAWLDRNRKRRAGKEPPAAAPDDENDGPDDGEAGDRAR